MIDKDEDDAFLSLRKFNILDELICDSVIYDSVKTLVVMMITLTVCVALT